jgi:hypothetical protein
MRWLLVCATLFTFSLEAMSKTSSSPGDDPLSAETPPQKKQSFNPFERKEPSPPFDANLFRRDAQVLSGSGEFLFWTVNNGCLDYALKMKTPAWGPTNSYAQGTMESGSYNWDPGFRIGLTYFRAPRYWEVRGTYTRLSCRGSNTASKPSPDADYLTATWPQIIAGPLTEAESYLHMNYNLFDLNVDRYFIPNPHLRLRLVAGMVVAWIDQFWAVHYQDAVVTGSSIQNRWKFTGAGLKGGTIADWYWGRDIYITAMGMTGVLVGYYTNSSVQTTNYQPSPDYNSEVPVRNMQFSDTRPAFFAQMSLGPSWQKNFTHHRMEIFAGYEFTFWANINQIYHSTSGAPSYPKETWINSSMTGLQGLTTRMTLDF